jgi:hypothetical protein
MSFARDIEDAIKQLKAVKVDAIYVHPNTLREMQREIDLLKQSPFYPLSDKEKGLDTVVDKRTNVLGCRR